MGRSQNFQHEPQTLVRRQLPPPGWQESQRTTIGSRSSKLQSSVKWDSLVIIHGPYAPATEPRPSGSGGAATTDRITWNPPLADARGSAHSANIEELLCRLVVVEDAAKTYMIGCSALRLAEGEPEVLLRIALE